MVLFNDKSTTNIEFLEIRQTCVFIQGIDLCLEKFKVALVRMVSEPYLCFNGCLVSTTIKFT